MTKYRFQDLGIPLTVGPHRTSKRFGVVLSLANVETISLSKGDATLSIRASAGTLYTIVAIDPS